MNNLTIAAAVALALGAASAAEAQVAACATPDYALYVAGSSAAVSSFKTALLADLFSSETAYSSTNGDFEAFCGPVSNSGAANVPGLTAGSIAIVHYRAEGGSVGGVLPIVNGDVVNFLDLTGSGCNVLNPPTTGTSQVNGTTDSWGGCLTTHGVELGVSDLEPSAFSVTSGNYPTAYSTAAFGTATQAQLNTLTGSSVALFQQVFGIFVNTSGINGGGTGQPLNLSKETVAQILNGHYKNWSAVPSASGGAVSSSSQTIVIKNREAGSGTRTGASIYFLGQECSTIPLALRDPVATSSLDAYGTGDVLKQAASNAGAITYASIDNSTKQSALTMVTLSGVTPSNLAAASGQYDYWFEATAQLGNTTGTSGGITTPGGSAIAHFLTSGELSGLATAPHATDILAIPGAGPTATPNVGTVPLTSSAGTQTIYVNPFTRSKNSCNIPAAVNN
jgi:ABC-type phosphate transport system substrate-binding protein